MITFSELAEHSLNFIPMALLGVSILGTSHCIGMCGPLCGSFAKTNSQMISYHGFRLLSYSLVVSLVFAFKSAILELGFLGELSPFHAISLSGFLVLSSLTYLAVSRLRKYKPQSAKLLANFLSKHRLLNTKAIGFANGLMPCGWFYSFLVLIPFAPSYIHALAWTMCFWLPSFIVLGFLTRGLSHLASRNRWNLRGLLAILILSVSSYQFADRLGAHFDNSKPNGSPQKKWICGP